MKRYVWALLVIILFLAMAVGGFFFVYGFNDLHVYEEVITDREDYLRPEIVNVSALVIQEEEDQLRLFSCQEDRCEPKEIPDSIDSRALSDGQSWFRYIDFESKDRRLNGRKRVLQRLWLDQDKEPTTIVEQTPLVKPRDLIMSPDSKKIAYWLDNTDATEDRLTELWIYNEELGSAHLLLEDVFWPDVHTRPRWNKSSTHLWFVANVAPAGEAENLELIVVDIQSVGHSASFLELDWAELVDLTNHGVMDINLSGNSIVFATPSGRNRSTITIYEEGEGEKAVTVRGEVAFVQWLEDDRLLYAVQDDRGFTFWQLQGEIHRHVTRHNGILRSVHGDVRGEYLAFITQLDRQQSKIFVLHIDSGLSREQVSLPPSGSGGTLVYVEQGRVASQEAIVAGVTLELDDGQLIAFIEGNLGSITGINDVKSSRILIADDINTLYVDYGPEGGNLTNRVLLTVRDAIHPEWSIRARYEAAGVSWRKLQGGGLQDPDPIRVYEWEEQVSQWILKQEF